MPKPIGDYFKKMSNGKTIPPGFGGSLAEGPCDDDAATVGISVARGVPKDIHIDVEEESFSGKIKNSGSYDEAEEEAAQEHPPSRREELPVEEVDERKVAAQPSSSRRREGSSSTSTPGTAARSVETQMRRNKVASSSSRKLKYQSLHYPHDEERKRVHDEIMADEDGNTTEEEEDNKHEEELENANVKPKKKKAKGRDDPPPARKNRDKKLEIYREAALQITPAPMKFNPCVYHNVKLPLKHCKRHAHYQKIQKTLNKCILRGRWFTADKNFFMPNRDVPKYDSIVEIYSILKGSLLPELKEYISECDDILSHVEDADGEVRLRPYVRDAMVSIGVGYMMVGLLCLRIACRNRFCWISRAFKWHWTKLFADGGDDERRPCSKCGHQHCNSQYREGNLRCADMRAGYTPYWAYTTEGEEEELVDDPSEVDEDEL